MPNGNLKRLVLAALLTGYLTATATAAWAAEVSEDASTFVAYVQEYAGNCVARNGVQILVRNTHPTRSVKVWFDRYHMGSGTGDRSRSELRPGAEPEPLGCSRNAGGPQEWRLVRAIFVD